jgi:hypothetical protein
LARLRNCRPRAPQEFVRSAAERTKKACEGVAQQRSASRICPSDQSFWTSPRNCGLIRLRNCRPRAPQEFVRCAAERDDFWADFKECKHSVYRTRWLLNSPCYIFFHIEVEGSCGNPL